MEIKIDTKNDPKMRHELTQKWIQTEPQNDPKLVSQVAFESGVPDALRFHKWLFKRVRTWKKSV